MWFVVILRCVCIVWKFLNRHLSGETPLWKSFSLNILFEHLFFSIFAQFTSHSFRYLLFRSYFGVMCLFIAANSVSAFSFCPVVLRLQVQSWDTTRFTLREFFKFLSDYLFWNYMSCVYSAWYHLESEVFSFWVIVFYFVHFAFLLSNDFVQLGYFIFHIGIRFVSPLGHFSFLINGITHLSYDCWQCPLVLCC